MAAGAFGDELELHKRRPLAASLLKRALAPGAVLFWDDADRDAAQIRQAAAALGAAPPRFLATDKGAAMAVMPGAGTWTEEEAPHGH